LQVTKIFVLQIRPIARGLWIVWALLIKICR